MFLTNFMLFWLFLSTVYSDEITVCKKYEKSEFDDKNLTSQCSGQTALYEERGEKGDKGPKGDRGEPADTKEIQQLKTNLTDLATSLERMNRSFEERLSNLYSRLNATKQNCPGVTFHFPRPDQITDYVRYRAYVPSMTDLSLCAWMEIKFDLPNTRTPFSYSSKSEDNELALDVGQNEVTVYTHSKKPSYSFSLQSLQSSPKFHLCLRISKSTQVTEVFVNSIKRDNKTNNQFNGTRGGGILILGQDQDDVNFQNNGGFAAADSFKGNITNLMMWPRLLSDQEIHNIATKCDCPQDYSVAMTMDKSELYGEAYYSVPDQCPTL